MYKILFFTLTLGCFMSYDTLSISSDFMDDIKELDLILLAANWDVNRPGKLPTTPRGIMESWCRPMLDKFVRATDIIDRMFEHNSALLIINKITGMTQLKVGLKLCKKPQIFSKVAHFNRKFNRIIPRLIPWYKVTLNTYLSVADPGSEVDASELSCLCEKSWKGLLAFLPPNLRENLLNILTTIYMKDANLIQQILNHMNIDTNVKTCQLENEPAPNPLGINSVEMAALMAWDKVLRK